MNTAWITSSLLAMASADVGTMISQMEVNLQNSSLPRAFTGAVANALNTLVNDHGGYGCWCYFYDDVGRGKGTPVDEIDSFCKVLNDGYECAIRDSEDEGVSCVPWEVFYGEELEDKTYAWKQNHVYFCELLFSGVFHNPGLGAGGALHESCQLTNRGDACAARACTIFTGI